MTRTFRNPLRFCYGNSPDKTPGPGRRFKHKWRRLDRRRWQRLPHDLRMESPAIPDGAVAYFFLLNHGG